MASFMAAPLLLISAALTGCGPVSPNSSGIAPVLLFAGTEASPDDVAAVEAILNSNHVNYATANSFQLNGMPEPEMSAYRLLIVTGGNFVDMGTSLTASTTVNVRNAVHGGMNYLGICAGGFLAGSFPDPYKSFDLSSGVKFGFYSAEKSGTRKAAVKITTVDAQALDQFWVTNYLTHKARCPILDS